MKLFFTSVLLIISLAVSAQWSNTTNLFYDSLHMPVSTASKTQSSPIVVQSYPDSGYFVIWQDYRNDPGSYSSLGGIYAQKYDKNGNQLWANNGVPISATTNNQHYTNSGQDYRSRSYAATDSAGGFYIAYADDSVTNYVWQRGCVQHMLSSGNTVFPKGNILLTATSANFDLQPQLIADGNKGFFVSFRETLGTVDIVCYKDVNGSLQYFGGGKMNENAVEVTATSACGNYDYLQYPDANVNDYIIFSDLQGGCNIVMSLSGNGSQGVMLAYNKLFRAKKNATATETQFDLDYSLKTASVSYQKDNVYRLYYLRTNHQEIHCGSVGGNVYIVNQYRLTQLGYQVLDGGSSVYDLSNCKGVEVSTAGNINVSLLAACKRSYSSSTGVSNASVLGYNIKEEIYDSIPYQRASSNNAGYPGYNLTEPAGTNKLNFFRDTLLAPGVSIYDFCLGGGSNQIFTSALMADPAYTTFSLALRLQHLAVERQSADSFAVVYKTSKKIGELIGKDQGDTRYGTEFSTPIISVNKNGVALFDIKDNYDAGARVSPIFNGAQLAWGALGRQVGTGVYNGSYYNIGSPNICFDPLSGKGLIAWSDDRNASASGTDILMRHLDSLNLTNYYPPVKRIRLIPNVYTATSSLPAVLYGVSKRYTLLETYAPYGSDIGITPVAEIRDDNYLGLTTVRVYQNTGTTRKYNNKPYLDRNFTIYADSIPPGSSINIRLYFTKIEFNALKASDNSISSPANLVVIKQPHNSSSYSTTYTPVANEQLLTPVAWDSVAGGYYVEVMANSLGDFFLFKTAALDYFRTKASGNWNNITTWESSPNNVNWTAATVTPDSTANTITILNGHTVTVTANVVIDQTVINTGGSVIINNGDTLSVTDGTGDDIVVNGSVTVNNGGSLLLRSTALGTASVGASTGTVTGNVTTERFIGVPSAKRAWRLLTAPLKSNTGSNVSIFNTWQNNGNTSMANNGAFITALVTPDANNGIDYYSGGSLKYYDGTNLVDVNNTKTTSLFTAASSAANNGYFLFVRGDRTGNLSTVSTTTLKTTGALQLGTQTFAASAIANNYTLIGNPYASPVNFASLTKNNLANRFYSWDPNLSTYGAYVLVDYNGSGYTIVPNPSSPGSGSTAQTQMVQSGQAFFVQTAAAASASLIFNEASKSSSTINNVFRTSSAEESIRADLFLINADKTTTLADGVMAQYKAGYSNDVNIEDANKLTNINENLSIYRKGTNMALERRSLIANADTLFLKLWNTTQRSYQFVLSAQNLDHPNLSGYLYDNYLKTSTPVNLNGTTFVNFTVTNDAASSSASRFSIVFGKDVMVNTKPAIVLYPNPVQNGNLTLQFNNMPKGLYNVQLVNSLGQIILNKQISHAEGTSTETFVVNKIKGVYMLEIIKPGKTKLVDKIIIN